jgi:aryl-alcohol dehydrogenase (NADP+)
MEFVKLGRTGLDVSILCLGTMTYGSKSWRPWVLEEPESRPILQRAVELGIRFFDTADMYSLGHSEEIVGRAIRELCRRDEVVLASKLFFPLRDDGPNRQGLSRKRIYDCVDASLRRLGTDYIDLYQVHRFDPRTPIEETLRALDDVVRAGKVRYIGASGTAAWEFARALYAADLLRATRFVSMQNHYNLVYRDEEREMLPLCRAEGIGVIPYSPLARGFLSGSRQRQNFQTTVRAETDVFGKAEQFRDSDWAVLDKVREVATRHGATPAQVAVAWVRKQPAVTAPIIGVRTIEQLEAMVAALDIELSDDDCRAMEDPYQPRQPGSGL